MKYLSVILGIASTFLLASCNDSMKDVNNSGDEIAASISAKAGQKRQGGNKPEDSGVFRGEDVLKCIENPELCAGDGQLNAKSEVHISSFVKGCLEAPNQCNDKIEVIVALNDQPVTGTYRIYISRVWSYDTDLELKMAWSVSLQ